MIIIIYNKIIINTQRIIIRINNSAIIKINLNITRRVIPTRLSSYPPILIIK
jgi:hypothetical protein